jgi:hypothetical protein
MTADIKDFYLTCRLPDGEPEWFLIPASMVPIDLQQKWGVYNSDPEFQRKGNFVCKVVGGMYGLPQAGRIAQKELITHLGQYGYHQTKNTTCLFKHESRPISFTLVVDDFGIKYQNKDDAEHLIAAIRDKYVLKVDWEGQKYLGIVVRMDYVARTCTISMPHYVNNALARFKVSKLGRQTNSPAIYVAPKYGQHEQIAVTDDSDPLLNDADIKFIEEVCGVFLYYARVIDSTMLCVINKIASRQSEPTAAVLTMVERFLQYAACHPNATIVYHASDMVLKIHSDASYLGETKGRSRAGGIAFFDNAAAPFIANQGAVDIISTILPSVAASAAEAEYGALFLNAQNAIPLRNTAEDLGHPQGATDMQCDNECAYGIANDTVKQRRSKAIDMRYHWVRDRVRLNQFTVTWAPGKDNRADFFTKIHPVHHHESERHRFITYTARPP